jgi:hypothetical protein
MSIENNILSEARGFAKEIENGYPVVRMSLGKRVSVHINLSEIRKTGETS